MKSERRKGNEKLEEVSRRLEEQMKRANQLELELNLLKVAKSVVSKSFFHKSSKILCAAKCNDAPVSWI